MNCDRNQQEQMQEMNEASTQQLEQQQRQQSPSQVCVMMTVTFELFYLPAGECDCLRHTHQTAPWYRQCLPDNVRQHLAMPQTVPIGLLVEVSDIPRHMALSNMPPSCVGLSVNPGAC